MKTLLWQRGQRAENGRIIAKAMDIEEDKAITQGREAAETRAAAENPAPEGRNGTEAAVSVPPRAKVSRKEMFIEFIIDGTFSFSRVFARVYHSIEEILERFGNGKNAYAGMNVYYGLAVLHDDGVELHRFSERAQRMEEQYFTESRTELLAAVRDISFYGGNPDGREDLRSALDAGLYALSLSRTNACRGLFLFSDSLPEKEELSPDFLAEDQNGGKAIGHYRNKGISFGAIFTYTDEFMPKLRVTNCAGEMLETGSEANEVYYYALSGLCSESRGEIIDRIHRMADLLFEQIAES